MSTAERSTPPLEPKRRGVDETRYVPDEMVEAFVVTDPHQVRTLKARREATGFDHKDEMWEGFYVVSPDPNNEHHLIGAELIIVFGVARRLVGGGYVLGGGNISDRVEGWHKNYRIPGVAVYLAGTSARNCGTHRCGGPDLAVEILSVGDQARKKLAFYAQVNTRELLILDRDPWTLELYRLVDGRLVLIGTSTPDQPGALASEVLRLTFRLTPGEERPTLEVGRLDGGQVWQI